MIDVRTRAAPTIDHLTITAGAAGPGSGASEMQDAAHRILGEPESTGWDHQVRSRPTLMLGYERAWPATQLGFAMVWSTARVGFTMVQRSREFREQGGPDRFGQLTVSFAY